MKQSWPNRIAALLILMVFAIESFGMSVNFHYCQGELFSMNLFGEAEKCQMVDSQSDDEPVHPCCQKRKEKLNNIKGPKFESSCCSDKTVEFNTGDLDANETSINISQIDELVLCSEIFQFKSPVNFIYPQVTLHNGDPPFNEQSRLILYQVFRI